MRRVSPRLEPPSNREVDDRTVPHGAGVFADDRESMRQHHGAHLLRRVVGKGKLRRHGFVLVGVVNDGVAPGFHDRLDVPEIAVDQVQIDMAETPEREYEIHGLRCDTGEIRAVVLDRLDMPVALERLVELGEQLGIVVDGIDGRT